MEKRPYFRSLRGKITNRTLFIGLVPVLVVGGLAWASLNQLTENATSGLSASESELIDNVVGANLTSSASRTVEQLDTFLLERISDAVVWASAPTVISAAKRAAIAHENAGLEALSIDDV